MDSYAGGSPVHKPCFEPQCTVYGLHSSMHARFGAVLLALWDTCVRTASVLMLAAVVTGASQLPAWASPPVPLRADERAGGGPAKSAALQGRQVATTGGAQVGLCLRACLPLKQCAAIMACPAAQSCLAPCMPPQSSHFTLAASCSKGRLLRVRVCLKPVWHCPVRTPVPGRHAVKGCACQAGLLRRSLSAASCWSGCWSLERL